MYEIKYFKKVDLTNLSFLLSEQSDAMARGGKRGRKPKGMSRISGPSSTDRPKSVKTMDELVGITNLEVSDEEEEHEKAKETKQTEVEISEWVDMTEKLEQDVACGKQINVPILKQKINGTVDLNEGMKEPVRITEDDIEDEVNFWKPSIVGYVAGANPPMHVLEGFVRRIWKEEVDKVGMIAHGVFLIKFISEEVRDRAINGGFIFF